jgi:hypothetical protein
VAWRGVASWRDLRAFTGVSAGWHTVSCPYSPRRRFVLPGPSSLTPAGACWWTLAWVASPTDVHFVWGSTAHAWEAAEPPESIPYCVGMLSCVQRLSFFLLSRPLSTPFPPLLPANLLPAVSSTPVVGK